MFAREPPDELEIREVHAPDPPAYEQIVLVIGDERGFHLGNVVLDVLRVRVPLGWIVFGIIAEGRAAEHPTRDYRDQIDIGNVLGIPLPQPLTDCGQPREVAVRGFVRHEIPVKGGMPREIFYDCIEVAAKIRATRFGVGYSRVEDDSLQPIRLAEVEHPEIVSPRLVDGEVHGARHHEVKARVGDLAVPLRSSLLRWRTPPEGHHELVGRDNPGPLKGLREGDS